MTTIKPLARAVGQGFGAICLALVTVLAVIVVIEAMEG